MPSRYPIVMIWRRVDDLHKGRSVARGVLNLPLVGEDDYSVIYDGGGAIIGLWTQDEKALLAGDSCSALNFNRYPLVSNPASEMVFAAKDMAATVRQLSDVSSVFFTNPMQRSDGTAVTFFDGAGNMSSVLEPNESRNVSGTGDKLHSLLGTRGVRGDVPPDRQASAGLVGYSLLSRDIGESVSFYQEVLGFEPLGQTEDRADFDAGNLILTVRRESAEGLLSKLRAIGRLQGDWLILLVENIRIETEALAQRGVAFPQGLETSGIGQMAYFEDLDGHPLVLWQPSGKTTREQPIDFYPVLRRLRHELTT